MIITPQKRLVYPLWRGRGLVAYWDMTDDANDCVGRGKATLAGGPTKTVTRLGNRLTLNGSSQYATVDNVVPFRSVKYGTVIARILPTVNQRSCIFSFSNPSSSFSVGAIEWNSIADAFSVYVYNPDLLASQFNGNTGGSYPVNNEYFIAFVVGSNGNTFNVNGIQVPLSYTEGNSTKSMFMQDIKGGIQDISVGVRNSNYGLQLYYGGQLSVGVFNRALTAQEIRGLYATSHDIWQKPAHCPLYLPSYAVQRRTLSPLGTRIGSRQG